MDATKDLLADLLDAVESRDEALPRWLTEHALDTELSGAWTRSRDPGVLVALHFAATGERVRLVLAACACARTALAALPPAEARPRRAIEAAEAWARGEVPIEVVEDAHGAAALAALTAPAWSREGDAARGYSAANAAVNAAYAAFCSEPDDSPGDVAAVAVSCAADAAPAAGDGEARDRRAALAEIVRAWLACPTRAQLLQRFA